MDQQVATPLGGVGVARAEAPEGEGSVWRQMGQGLRRDKAALIGAFVVLAFVLVAIFAPFLAPHNPTQQFTNGISLDGGPLPPGADKSFPLGTDALGRDLLSRLIYGARISLIIGILANGLAILIGVSVGSIAAFYGGWIDVVLMRFTDIMMAFPVLLFAIALIAITGPSLSTIIVVIAILYWTYTARVIHGMVLSLKEKEFVEAARALGARQSRILVRYVLPHLVSVVVVYATLGIATTVIIEASLSFVGVGVPPPTPTWGGIVNDAQSYYRADPTLVIFPGLAIMATVLGFNLLGDWLRDTLDPVQRQIR